MKYYLAHALFQAENYLERSDEKNKYRKLGKQLIEGEIFALQAVQDMPNVEQYRILLGKIQFKMKKYEEAGEHFTMAAELL